MRQCWSGRGPRREHAQIKSDGGVGESDVNTGSNERQRRPFLAVAASGGVGLANLRVCSSCGPRQRGRAVGRQQQRHGRRSSGVGAGDLHMCVCSAAACGSAGARRSGRPRQKKCGRTTL